MYNGPQKHWELHPQPSALPPGRSQVTSGQSNVYNMSLYLNFIYFAQLHVYGRLPVIKLFSTTNHR